MANILFTNLATSKLAAGITPAAVSLNVLPGTGALYPSPTGGAYFYVTLVDPDGNNEIVKVTARNVDTLTIIRAQDGTTARTFPAESLVDLRVNAGALKDINDSIASTVNTAISNITPESIGAVNSHINIVSSVAGTMDDYTVEGYYWFNPGTGPADTPLDINTQRMLVVKMGSVSGLVQTMIISQSNTPSATAVRGRGTGGGWGLWVLSGYLANTVDLGAGAPLTSGTVYYVYE